MSELKLCSYCKSVPQANIWITHGISETRYRCPNPECPHSVRTVTLEEWNTRPIEDELRARIAELEALVERLIEAGDRLSDSLCTYPEEEKTIEVCNWNAIVAEYKECEK